VQRLPIALFAIVLAAAVAVSSAHAEDAQASSKSVFSHAFVYTGEVFAKLHGGLRRGATYTGLAQLSLDWTDTDWLAHTDIYMPHGESFNGRYVGGFSDVSNIDAVHQLRVHELWAQRTFGRVSLRTGLLAADTEFWVPDTANLFISSAFGAPSVVSGDLPNAPIFPQGVLGARLAFNLKHAGTLRLAVLDGNGGDQASVNRHGLHISLDEGALWLAEYQRVIDMHGDKKTSVRLAAFHHTGIFTNTQGHRVRGNNGFIGSVDHTVDARLSVFARVGAAMSDRSAVPWSVETGFNLSPVFGTGDKLGVGLAYVDLNGSTAITSTATPLRGEGILESTLDWPINRSLDLQPDVQYIIDPGGTAAAPNAWAVGLRATVQL
jgi:porin